MKTSKQKNKNKKQKKKQKNRIRDRNRLTKKSFISYNFSLTQLLIPGPVPTAMPSDMETTRAGRPVDSKFEGTTESNDDDDV